MDKWVSLVTGMGSTLVAIATIIASAYNSRKQREHDLEMRKQEHDHNFKMREQEINAEKELKKQEWYITNELEVYKNFIDKYTDLTHISTLPDGKDGYGYVVPEKVDHEKASAFVSSVSRLRLIAGIDVDEECKKLCFELNQSKYLTGSETDELFQSIVEKIKQRQTDIQNSQY